jgi:hypothetical protein
LRLCGIDKKRRGIKTSSMFRGMKKHFRESGTLCGGRKDTYCDIREKSNNTRE